PSSPQSHTYQSEFLFIPPPPPTLPLLQKTPINQSKHIPPFPVTRFFLPCTNKHLIEKHHPKLYPNATLPPPPIWIPHLHTPFLNREPALLFP
ncbi:malate:quinone oxidoreductase, partial [Staphylococcus haemolyticus]|uniref:malate:quinone oxidoreductase n=1 Tax=Staphylococcus haemolyticus TaxID=1283 RepID=UPI001642699B